MRKLQTTVMSFGDPTADRKAKSRADPVTLRARAHLIRAKEALENARLEFCGNALPRVADPQSVLRIFVSARDRNGPAARRVLDCVVQEIHDQAAEQCLIGANRHFPGRFALKRDLFCKHERAHVVRAIRGERSEEHTSELQSRSDL